MPAKDVLREMMKPSQNLYAQLLLLQVGAARAYGPEATETRASTETATAMQQRRALKLRKEMSEVAIFY
jgi:D-alanyl-D-alanine carboxypeptidase